MDERVAPGGGDEYAIVRSMLQHEDSLRDQRLGWFLTLNGFLFTALGFAWERSDSLTRILGWLGLVIAVSAFATLRVSALAIDRLRKMVGDSEPVAGISGSELKGLPGPDRYLPHLYLWNIAPVAIAVAWIVILRVGP